MSDIFEKFKDILSGRSGGQAMPTGPVEYIVAGLGNPGPKYAVTRHNAGFMAADRLAEKCGASVSKLRFGALCGEAMISGKRAMIIKPVTYMNNSGDAVRDVLHFYKLPPERLIVISDETALDLGKLRIRRSGSDGGQKGLRSIIAQTGANEFPRVRIGVGKKPHPDMDMADWVLSSFQPDEQKSLEPALEAATAAVELIIDGKIDEAMNKFN